MSDSQTVARATVAVSGKVDSQDVPLTVSGRVQPGQGLLVTIISAQNLRNADADDRERSVNGAKLISNNASTSSMKQRFEKGLSDPFAICEVNRKKASSFQTFICKDTLHPVWNFQKQILYFSKGDPLNFTVWDKDEGSDKDLLGICKLEFDMYHPDGFEGTVDLDCPGGKYLKEEKVATIQLKVEVLGAPKAPTMEYEKAFKTFRKGETKTFDFAVPLHLRPEYHKSRGLAVTVLCATNLPNRDKTGLSDPWVLVEIPNREDSSFKTPVVMNCLNPIWHYTGQLRNYKRDDYIKFVIWDKDAGIGRSQADLLGKAELQYEEYCNGCEGRLMLPGNIGRPPGWLTVRVEILGPVMDRAPEKILTTLKVNTRSRETKHIFLNYLKHRRGTTFLGWRLDMDRRLTNRVEYSDLMASCRSLGLSLTESRRLWLAYRPGGKSSPSTPLEFAEFDPVEFSNLNGLLEALWQELNFDLDLAWSIMDPKDKGWVTLEEFEIGLDRISFEGDSRLSRPGELIFKGLDTGGKGMLWRHELECLKMMSPESHAHPEYSPLVYELRYWVKQKYGGTTHLGGPTNALLFDLGCRHGGTNASITVRGMSDKLRRLGFGGDALHTCMTISRCNASILLHELVELLDRKTAGPRQSLSYAGRKWGFRPTERRKHAHDNTMEKPAWNATIYDPALLNVCLGHRERHYFLTPFDRPIRDERLKDLEDNQGFRFKQEGDKGEKLSRTELRMRGGQDVGGIRPARHEDLMRIQAAVKEWEQRTGKTLEPFPDPESESKSSQREKNKGKRGSQDAGKNSPTRQGSPESPSEPANICVYIIGGQGLSDADDVEKTDDVYCTCQIKDRDDTNFRKDITRETAINSSTFKGLSKGHEKAQELIKFTPSDALEFYVKEPAAEGDEDDDDICLGMFSLSGTKIFPNGFEGAVDLLDEEENVQESKVVLKIEILSS